MNVERGTIEHIQQWAQLRGALWPDCPVAGHRNEVLHTYLSGNDRAAAFICRTGTGEVIGFAEVTLRSDYVNGCETSPVLFLEGIYVRPDHRRKGAARLLYNSAADWGMAMGCSEFASDAPLDNTESHEFHAALGFQETERVVYFRKIL
jgi:aminoglycoside 6'-N-acetyltransferase I